MGTDGCRKGIAHGTMSAGEKKLLVLLVVEGLIAPYHVLSHVNCYCGSVCKQIT